MPYIWRILGRSLGNKPYGEKNKDEGDILKFVLYAVLGTAWYIGCLVQKSNKFILLNKNLQRVTHT